MWTWLKWLFWGSDEAAATPTKAPDTQREAAVAVPQPQIEVVAPVIATRDARWYMTAGMLELLKLIRLHESGKAGYNADFRNDDKWNLANYNFDQVVQLSRRQVKEQGEPSSAIGAYQFLTKTLLSLKESLSLTGTERFLPQFQDDLAVALMIRRGMLDFVRGSLSLSGFCNNLAMEWASLPVVTQVRRGNRVVKIGQSYYAGDGLNKAFHKPETILAAVERLGIELRKAKPKET